MVSATAADKDKDALNGLKHLLCGLLVLLQADVQRLQLMASKSTVLCSHEHAIGALATSYILRMRLISTSAPTLPLCLQRLAAAAGRAAAQAPGAILPLTCQLL